MKKIFSIILVLALFMSIVTLQAVADYTYTVGNDTITLEGTKSGDYTYTLDGNKNATITGYIGKGGNITIPSALDGHTVTVIGGYVFFGCESLKSVTIPSSVTEIRDTAFSYCDKLTSVTIPNSVILIGESAFLGCSSLKSVTIPNGIKSIKAVTFAQCTSLTSVTIPSSVISIERQAFQGCTSLTSVTIPSSVTSIGEIAFEGCTSLASVTIQNSAATIGDKAFVKTPWYSRTNEFTIDENGVLTAYNGLGGNVTIPSSVKSIAASSFTGCTTITSVTIPNGVTSIADGSAGRSAFWECKNLTSVTIPNSMTYIGTAAFQACASLKSIIIPSSITSISDDAFQGCTGLTSVTLPNSITKIGAGAFNFCTSLKSVTIPNSVTTIGINAFMACENLTTVTIPSSVTWLDGGYMGAPDGSSPFAHCYKLTAINVDSNNPKYMSDAGILFNKDKTTIMQYPSYKAGTSYTIPSSVTSMNNGIFMNCKNLKSITIPNTITKISDGAFLWCSSLTSLVIPSSVTYIDNFAFRDCLSLKSITIPPSVTATGADLFMYCPKDMKIYGVAGSDAQNLAKDNGFAFTAIKAPVAGGTPLAVPSATKMAVNGVNVAVDSYIINGNNYIKLRDLAAMVNNTDKNFNVTWDGANNAINLLTHKPYTVVGGEMAKGDGASKTPAPNTSKIYIDGKLVALTAYNISQNNYFKLRDVMQVFNIAVGYDNTTKTATLDTSKGYVAP